ncbi:hypothetical protein ACPPVW_12260 [Leifsonia sp. McL0607]|uniref:hypothetical protein n=1 Tax=Leifsonia sp. McL0607 TaxID=3415672 RepID=UPI003CE8AD2A
MQVGRPVAHVGLEARGAAQLFRVSTTVNAEAVPPLSSSVAAMQKTVATMPESRFMRTGVPNRLEKTPK